MPSSLTFLRSQSPPHSAAVQRVAKTPSPRTPPLPEEENFEEETSLTGRMNRRQWVRGIMAFSTASSLVVPSAQAMDGSSGLLDNDDMRNVKVTHRVAFDVRISRQDGTFYVRDDLPPTPENQVFLGRLVVGLFGNVAPHHVERFLSYVETSNNNGSILEDDNPLPMYSRSVFPSLDQATGVIVGGKIPSLEATTVNGSPALRYGGRLLPSKLWVETDSSTTSAPKLSHVGRGLLTHRDLEVLPVFGITTRTDTRTLDGTHTVFGRLLLDENENDANAFLNILTDLPTYTVDRAVVNNEENVVESSARAVYAAQRQFFRSAAQVVGDSRLDKVYEGKLLRRVEVTRAVVL